MGKFIREQDALIAAYDAACTCDPYSSDSGSDSVSDSDSDSVHSFLVKDASSAMDPDTSTSPPQKASKDKESTVKKASFDTSACAASKDTDLLKRNETLAHRLRTTDRIYGNRLGYLSGRHSDRLRAHDPRPAPLYSAKEMTATRSKIN